MTYGSCVEVAPGRSKLALSAGFSSGTASGGRFGVGFDIPGDRCAGELAGGVEPGVFDCFWLLIWFRRFSCWL